MVTECITLYIAQQFDNIQYQYVAVKYVLCAKTHNISQDFKKIQIYNIL